MASWRKLLAQMVADPKPVGYTYDEAARVLEHLGFELAPGKRTSHRVWRYRRPGRASVTVELVDEGRGCMKRWYIQDMIKALQEGGFLSE